MILLFLIVSAAYAQFSDEEVFGPQPDGCEGFESISQSGGKDGKAAKGWVTGGLTGVAEVVKGKSQDAMARSSLKYVMAVGGAAANFAGPLAGVGIGLLTDLIFPDKTQEENLKKFDCVAKHMERMKGAITQNRKLIAQNTAFARENSARITGNTQLINQLAGDTQRWLSQLGGELGEALTQHSIVTEWNELKSLNEGLINCLSAESVNGKMQWLSTTKMQEQENQLALEMFDLLASELNEDKRRALKEEHAERRRLGEFGEMSWHMPEWDCSYTHASAKYEKLKTRLANMEAKFELMHHMVKGGNCYISLEPFWQMATLAEDLVLAVENFLLGAKMRGYLSIKKYRDEYFGEFLPKLAKIQSAFINFADQMNSYKTIRNAECINKSGNDYPWMLGTSYWDTARTKKLCNAHDWCLGFSTRWHGNWLVSDYDLVKNKGASTRWGTKVTVDGVRGSNYCHGCEHLKFEGGRGRSRRDDHFCGRNPGCQCIIKQPIAGKDTENCKRLKGATPIIAKIGDHLRSLERVVRQTKSNHERWAANGKEQRKRFEAPQDAWYWVLTGCPEDHKPIYSIMEDQNYRPHGQKGAITGCVLDPRSTRRRRKGGCPRCHGGRFRGRLRHRN